MNLVITPPMREILIIKGADNFLKSENFVAIRKRPYLPNFNKMPARIIEPATGASTCAFGSHRWVRYIGVFTKKAIIEINHQI